MTVIRKNNDTNCYIIVIYIICRESNDRFGLKTRPSAESKGINAAICYKIILDCNDDLLKGNFFISDGARNLSHVTHFQDYLQKYFGFRKAYCRLRVVYRPLFKPIIAILFLFKNFLKKFDSYSLFHKINAILLAEEVSRDCKLE